MERGPGEGRLAEGLYFSIIGSIMTHSYANEMLTHRLHSGWRDSSQPSKTLYSICTYWDAIGCSKLPTFIFGIVMKTVAPRRRFMSIFANAICGFNKVSCWYSEQKEQYICYGFHVYRYMRSSISAHYIHKWTQVKVLTCCSLYIRWNSVLHLWVIRGKKAWKAASWDWKCILMMFTMKKNLNWLTKLLTKHDNWIVMSYLT